MFNANKQVISIDNIDLSTITKATWYPDRLKAKKNEFTPNSQHNMVILNESGTIDGKLQRLTGLKSGTSVAYGLKYSLTVSAVPQYMEVNGVLTALDRIPVMKSVQAVDAAGKPLVDKDTKQPIMVNVPELNAQGMPVYQDSTAVTDALVMAFADMANSVRNVDTFSNEVDELDECDESVADAASVAD